MLCLACVYLWFLVLRVPQLGRELAEWPEEVEEEEAKVEEVVCGEAAAPMSEAQVAESYPDYQPEAAPQVEAEPDKEEAQVVDELVDPGKAQELRQKGNEDFKAGASC